MVATMSDIGRLGEPLTIEHLAVVKNHLSSIIHEDSLPYGMATEVLRFFLGDLWVNENVFSMHNEVGKRNRDGRQFLKTDSMDMDSATNFRHQSRVVRLAECFFNLQKVTGFKQRIDDYKTQSLESFLGEVECAKIISAAELQLHFVKASGTKGLDYEGEIVSPGGRTICCEMKAKLERTELSAGSITDTLELARKQVPADKPSIVFVRMPETWTINSEFKTAADAAIKSCLRNTRRIVAIIVVYEIWLDLTPLQCPTAKPFLVSLFKYKPHFNLKSTFFGEDVRQVFEVAQRGDPTWIRFSENRPPAHNL